MAFLRFHSALFLTRIGHQSDNAHISGLYTRQAVTKEAEPPPTNRTDCRAGSCTQRRLSDTNIRAARCKETWHALQLGVLCAKRGFVSPPSASPSPGPQLARHWCHHRDDVAHGPSASRRAVSMPSPTFQRGQSTVAPLARNTTPWHRQRHSLSRSSWPARPSLWRAAQEAESQGHSAPSRSAQHPR